MKAPLAVALLLATAWPSVALGADEGAANALLRQGADLFVHEEYEGARAAYARAYEIDPRPATLFNLALSELNAGHPVEAAAHLREYLTHADQPAAKLASVRTKWLPRAEGQTARLDVFAPTGTQVFVDGRVQPQPTPPTDPGGPWASIPIAAGEHDVSARQGTDAETQHVTARGGELVELHFQRVPEPPAQPSAIGWASNGDAGPPAGEETSRVKRSIVIALGLGTVAAAAVGVAFGIAAKNRASDAETTQNELAPGRAWTTDPCSGASGSSRLCMQLKSDVEANRQDWTLSAISYVGAGLLGVASVATWIGWKPKSAGLVASPTLGAHGAGIALDGQWE
jgi:hypothetical protein